MNFTELKDAALSDAHREDYAAFADRFTQEAEAFIYARLEAYGLEYQLTDADRIAVGSNIYNQPSKVISVRQVIYNKLPLDPRDESFLYNAKDANEVIGYVVRPRTIAFAGLPATGSTIDFHYWGVPAALVNGTDTNTLLNDYPTLYKRAIHISVYHRSRDLDFKRDAENDVKDLIGAINSQVKKKMAAGARSSNPYNTKWRSSY